MIGRLALALGAGLAGAAGAAAAPPPISLQDSFRIGSGGGILCTAQRASAEAALSDMFDQAYAIACRDAAAPVGRLYALRARGGDPAARLAVSRGGACGPASRAELDGLTVETESCTLEGGLPYRVYRYRRGGTLYVAEGLQGYDSVLRLALRTLVADRPVEGEISVAATGAGDAAALARVEAAALDPSRALIEGYRRNNSGDFAEAAEFFGAIAERETGRTRGEALVNEALQQSNLGNAGEAERLFAEAEGLGAGDPVTARMLRNYRAIHLMNRRRTDEALAELARPLSAAAADGARGLEIDAATAATLSAEGPGAAGLRAAASLLLPEERARILDAQALHLRGTLLRLGGRPDATPLEAALAELAAVRGGRVTSVIWMRAQILGELAALAESQGDAAEAERLHQAAIALLEADHPGSPALTGAQARLAGFLARAGRTEAALALYRSLVEASDTATASPTLRRSLAPYFELLARGAAGPDSAADLFRASQLLVRPGVAQTQAVLARELSAGSGEASRLFRQSVDLTRDIERGRVELSRLAADPQVEAARLDALRAELSRLEAEQAATQSRLAAYPSYRVLSGKALTLAELQQALRPGEAYYKVTVLGDDAFALFATPSAARAWKVPARAAALDAEVDALRATISLVENGRVLTYPFDVERAHRLYATLFGPIEAELTPVEHLVFEPDGAMLRLPPNLLVASRAGIAAYRARAARPGDDGFDFTGIEWLGRDRDVSTAVSARAFRDVRQAPASSADKPYLGFGENAPPSGTAIASSGVRSLLGEAPSCRWPLADWARPIPADELATARARLGGGDIVTGEAFTDSAIMAREDLSDYRVLHFATHGLVTPPRPECTAQPALMTSFGAAGSDGLLSFGEIYDLRLDADLVILSACDTAGKASLAATREAGLTSGGDFALDGLVRAFVGAGSRSVIASHWPVPDDFDATQRLISGLFSASPGASTASAMRAAQRALMDDPATSHPYYWAGFAIIGDGAAPIVPRS